MTLRSRSIRGHAFMVGLCFAVWRFDLAALWIDSLVMDAPFGERA